MENYTERPQVGFLEANKLAFTKIVDFKGRIRRSEFWWAILGLSIIALVTTWIPFIGNAFAIVVTLAEVSLTFRRLHDTNRSGWWIGGEVSFGVLLLGLMFFLFGAAILNGDHYSEAYAEEIAAKSIGGIAALVIGYIVALIWQVVIIVFCCIDSDPDSNKYGESPKYQSVAAAQQ